jgi:Tfp pilus assembly protein PilV
LKRLRASEGFTIIEALVAALVLVVGLISAFAALDLAAQTSYTTRAREGALNLAREITEDARALPYVSLTSSAAVTSAIQNMPVSGTTSTSPWKISRRGVNYTVTVTESDLPAVSQQTISQKQITVALSWTVNHVSRSFSETSTISSAGEGIGLSATTLQWGGTYGPTGCSSPCSATTPIITLPMGVNNMTFSVQTPANASGILWEVNGIVQSWSSTYTVTSSTTWTWTSTTAWNISSLPDGTYEIGAAAENGSQTGPIVRITVKLARGIPSAPSFTSSSIAGAGFNTNLWKAGVQQTAGVAELDWTGSNQVATTGNQSDINVVGYQLTNSSAQTCTLMLTNQTYPYTCAADTNIVCSGPTACIDFSPGATTTSPTYTLAALYYNSSNALTTAPSTSVTVSGQSPTTYTLAPTTQNTGTNCAAASPQNDLRTTYTPGAVDTTTPAAISVTANFCSAAFGQPAVVAAGGTATAYFTNASTSACTVTGYLNLNGGAALSTTATVAKSITTPTAVAFSWTFSNVTVNTGDRINNEYTWSCGSSAKPVQLHYGSTTYPSKFVTPTNPLQVPNAPTSLSVTSVSTNSDGTTNANLQWSAPTSGISVKAYRIYRDGKNYDNRIGEDTAANLCSAGVCTYTDSNRTGTHTYYVTAVGNTTTGSNMAESAALGPTTAQ